MRYILILSLILFSIATTTYNAGATTWTATKSGYSFSNKDLINLEKQIFGRSFSRETFETRIKRLEINLLGAIQSGSLDKRFQTLLTLAYQYKDNQNISTTTNNGLGNSVKKVFNTISGSGYMTGYTPPITPYGHNYPYGFPPGNPYYNNWAPPFNSSGNGYDKFHHDNFGYRHYHQTSGSGCGISILD